LFAYNFDLRCVCFVVYSVSGSETVEVGSQTSNPMVKLFCGQFLTAGINEGMLFACCYY